MRDNNFDLIRLLMAMIVLLVHCQVLSQNHSLDLIPHLVSSRVAVEVFFVISGFLIVASYEKCKSGLDYVIKRCRRILPGYYGALLFCVAIGLTLSVHVDLVSLAKYVLADIVFVSHLHPSFPGTFGSNPTNSAMNGALWTIKIEIMFYAFVPCLVWACRRYGRLPVLLGVATLSVIYHVLCEHLGYVDAARQLPGQLCYFSLGALGYYYLDIFRRWGWWLAAIAVPLHALHAMTGIFVIRPFSITTLTLTAAFLIPKVKGPTRWGDFSYGTYVLHFPVVQVLVSLHMFERAPWLSLVLCVVLVETLAVLSWFYVEKKWLKGREGMKPENSIVRQSGTIEFSGSR